LEVKHETCFDKLRFPLRNVRCFCAWFK